MIRRIKNFWAKLNRNQRITLGLLSTLLVLGPVSAALTARDVQITELMPATPPITPPENYNPISWQTPQVILKADDFYILVDGKRYNANAPDLRVSSDPGNPSYTTLEGTWHENGVEMRMFWYFYAENYQTDNGLARQWGVSEIRTYNGQNPYADWLYYGQKTPLGKWGQAYSADELNLIAHPGKTIGEIHFKNLYLHAFKNISPSPVPTPTPRPTPTVKPSPKPSVSPSPSPSPKPECPSYCFNFGRRRICMKLPCRVK